MENEQKCVIISMLFNTLLIVCALYCGTLIQNYTLICFGYYVMCDLIEDFLAFISSSVNSKRANKNHPFGYGKEENYSSLLIGIIITILGIYIFTSGLHLSSEKSNIFALLIMIGSFLIRYINAEYQFNEAKNEQSQMLMVTAIDGIKSSLFLLVGCILLLLNLFLPLADIIGTILISILIIWEGLKIVISNILYLNGQNDTSNAINDKIKRIVNKNENYNYINTDLINVRDYYLAVIDIEITDEVKLSQLLIMQYKLKRRIKKEIVNIRFIEFEIYKAN